MLFNGWFKNGPCASLVTTGDAQSNSLPPITERDLANWPIAGLVLQSKRPSAQRTDQSFVEIFTLGKTCNVARKIFIRPDILPPWTDAAGSFNVQEEWKLGIHHRRFTSTYRRPHLYMFTWEGVPAGPRRWLHCFMKCINNVLIHKSRPGRRYNHNDPVLN